MTSNYVIHSMIGKGSFGSVYKVTNIHNSKMYALKKIKTDCILHYEKTSIINELRLLSAHKCPFIIKFKTCFYENGHIYLVTEYASKGDLGMLIKKNIFYKTHFKEHIIWNYFLQTSVALCYLHSLKVIHRDIKPANIFVDADDNIKLGDFGIIKMMKSFMMYGQTQIGTPLYMCPEMYKRERYDTKVDSWSLGCILFELMTLKPPFMAKSIIELKEKIFKANYGSLNFIPYSKLMKDVLTQLLNVYPRQRISLFQILQKPGVQKELKSRNLYIPNNSEILNTFHINCCIPKNNKEWNETVLLFTSLNATIELNPSEIEELRKINMAKNLLVNQKNLKVIDESIEKLKVEIENAKKLIEECEKNIVDLEERKRHFK
jgi:serine/threonine protein kinase